GTCAGWSRCGHWACSCDLISTSSGPGATGRSWRRWSPACAPASAPGRPHRKETGMTIQERSGNTRTPWGSGADIFEAYYTGRQPAGWEIHRPQPAFEQLARDGELRGRVLD